MCLTQYAESSEMSGAEWDEDVFHHNPETNCWEVPCDTRGLRQEQRLSPAGRQVQQSEAQDPCDDEDGEKCFFHTTSAWADFK